MEATNRVSAGWDGLSRNVVSTVAVPDMTMWLIQGQRRPALVDLVARVVGDGSGGPTGRVTTITKPASASMGSAAAPTSASSGVTRYPLVLTRLAGMTALSGVVRCDRSGTFDSCWPHSTGICPIGLDIEDAGTHSISRGGVMAELIEGGQAASIPPGSNPSESPWTATEREWARTRVERNPGSALISWPMP